MYGRTITWVLGTLLMGAAFAQDGDLEIFSWWAGDEGPALEALIELYEQQYPDVEVVNATVTGGAGVNARAVLKTRMLGGDPPDSFQVHAGQELIGTWVAAERMEDLTAMFEEQGWQEALPPEVIEAVSSGDGTWSVPVNIHRSNVLWFVPDDLEEWGVEVPSSWDEFVNETCPTLQEQGVTPLVVGENWTVQHLWESVALAELGVQGWQDLWSGDLAFTAPEAMAVWDRMGEILECTNEDAAGLSWQQATDRVVEGDAAFNVMGDWAAGYMTTTLGLEAGDGFDWAASPGTEGQFMWLADSFGLPVGAPSADNARAWLELIGSVEGQNAFNPLKGSIPPRLDVEVTEEHYDAYQLSAAEDWQGNERVGSLVHGVTAPEGFMSEFAAVTEIYLNSGSAEEAAGAADEVAAQVGIGR